MEYTELIETSNAIKAYEAFVAKLCKGQRAELGLFRCQNRFRVEREKRRGEFENDPELRSMVFNAQEEARMREPLVHFGRRIWVTSFHLFTFHLFECRLTRRRPKESRQFEIQQYRHIFSRISTVSPPRSGLKYGPTHVVSKSNRFTLSLAWAMMLAPALITMESATFEMVPAKYYGIGDFCCIQNPPSPASSIYATSHEVRLWVYIPLCL